MTVRWKPLIVLSGLFAAVGIAGLLAFLVTMGSGDAGRILDQARDARDAGKFAEAEIHFRRALQRDSRNVAIHEEFVGLYDSWIERADPEERPRLEAQRLRVLYEATQRDKAATGPRVALLEESLRGEDLGEQARWARQVIGLDPDHLDANFVLALEAAEAEPFDRDGATRLLESLEATDPDRARTAWARAVIARRIGDDAMLAEALGAEPEERDAVDRRSRLRLDLLALEAAAPEEPIDERLAAIESRVDGILSDPELRPETIVAMAGVSDRVRKALEARDPTTAEHRWAPLADRLEDAFERTIDVDGPMMLTQTRAFAEHLNARGDRRRCLAVIRRALEAPIVGQRAFAPELLRLRETAVRVALSDPSDPERFALAGPHIDGLIASKQPEYQGLGHLFRGAIELERAGVAGGVGATEASSFEALLAARSHLKQAVEKLPEIATARALYGIALALSGESALGRQYLQGISRAESLEPRYRIWAAWSMLQAGYPEEAEPIVEAMLAAVEGGALPDDLTASLQLLRGEIAHARRAPADLQVARTAYEAAAGASGDAATAVALRQAELGIALDGPEAGLARLRALREGGQGGAALEHLTVSTLMQLDRVDEARATLDEARAAFPDSAPLATLDATLLIRDEQPAEAERQLAAFIERHPEHLDLVQFRARILADALDRIDEARLLLRDAAERTGTSSPLVQLALIELGRGDVEAAERIVDEVRASWPDASAGDLLQAQLHLTRGEMTAASKALDDALEKDPKNKVALFWRAKLDALTGSGARAAETFESIIRDQPVKRINGGLPLAAAAEWAMASMAIEHRDFDDAIRRLEGLARRDDSGKLARAARWKLAAARAAEGDWPTARAEIIALLKEPEATLDERAEAAQLFRVHGEPKNARTLAEQVLEQEPTHPGAVVILSYLLLADDRHGEAADLLRGAIDAGPQPAAIHLMLAGVLADDPSADKGSLDRARRTLEAGLEAHPDSIDLARALFSLIRDREGIDAAFSDVERRAEAEGDDRRFTRLLIDLHRAEGRLEGAERLARDLLDDEPGDARIAAALIDIVAARAAVADRDGDLATGDRLEAEAADLAERFGERFPDDRAFPVAAFRLAVRRGDDAEAEAIAHAIDERDPEGTTGPLLLATLYLRQGLADRAARAFERALDRDPLRDDIRLSLGRVLLEQGHPDRARLEAEQILARRPENPEAILLRAEALASYRGSARREGEGQVEAIRSLRAAVEERPAFAKAHHLLAEIHRDRGEHAEAIDALERALTELPGDPAALAMLVQQLVEDGSAASLARAEQVARRSGGGQEEARRALALSVGYHRGGRPDLARPWAERAANASDDPAAHLNLGDILMSIAEMEGEGPGARDLFEEAIACYDRVIARDADALEAVNNKAWILHRHLGRDREALAVVDRFLDRADRDDLPGAFFDTIGAIQEAVGRDLAAEESFSEGLRKAPDNPILNYHMGRLIAKDRARANRAARYLRKAREARDELPADVAAEVDDLLDQIGE